VTQTLNNSNCQEHHFFKSAFPDDFGCNSDLQVHWYLSVQFVLTVSSDN